METIIIPNGIIHLPESKAICPFCGRKIPYEEICKKFYKKDKLFIRIKCSCKRYIGITQNIRGDFVAYELNNKLKKLNKRGNNISLDFY